jgi:hypothetical protein
VIHNPMPQRQLRGHLPQRPIPRSTNSAEHLAFLARRLTVRDRWLVRVLREHRVLTTHQIAQTLFPSARSANKRLRELFTWRVIDRFQPFVTTGAAPMHYVLDTAGAAVLAREDGIDPKKVGYRHETSIGIAHSLRLAHTVAVNGHFTTLISHAGTTNNTSLTAWWSESRCRKHFGDLTRPDAYARWRVGDTELEYFLEFDLGTENLRILASKLRGYENLATTTALTTPGREAAARRALQDALGQLDRPHLLPIATSTNDSPSIAAWLPINGCRRLPLIELAEQWPDAGFSAVHDSLLTGDKSASELTHPEPMPPTRR